jgi:hypothetical protein
MKSLYMYYCSDVGEAESMKALKCMGEMIEDLGVCPLPDADVDSSLACIRSIIHFIFVM